MKKMTALLLICGTLSALFCGCAKKTEVQFVRYFTAYVVDGLEFVGDYASLWLLLISRVVLVALLYFLIMKAARAKILDESLAFLFRKNKQNDKI